MPDCKSSNWSGGNNDWISLIHRVGIFFFPSLHLPFAGLRIHFQHFPNFYGSIFKLKYRAASGLNYSLIIIIRFHNKITTNHSFSASKFYGARTHGGHLSLERNQNGSARFNGCSSIRDFELLGKLGEGTFG